MTEMPISTTKESKGFHEEEFINLVLVAEQEIKDGKRLSGDLDELAKGIE